MTQSQALSVLFACNLNRVRSPMAAALARRLVERVLVAESCGLEAAAEIDPFMAAAMLEVGIDLTDYQPKAFEALAGRAFDLVISLTPEAHSCVADRVRGGAAAVEYWPIADPTLASGSREQRLDAYRQVRDDLRRRLDARFGQPSTLAGRSG